MAVSTHHTRGILKFVYKIMHLSLKEISQILKDTFDFVFQVAGIKRLYKNISHDLALRAPE